MHSQDLKTTIKDTLFLEESDTKETLLEQRQQATQNIHTAITIPQEKRRRMKIMKTSIQSRLQTSTRLIQLSK
jgi:hypothetical protein